MNSALPIVGLRFFVFLLARVFGEISERLGVPALAGEIAAGIVIANFAIGSFHFLGWLALDPSTSGGALHQQTLGALEEVGVVFLVFAVGLEIRPSDLRPALPHSARTATFGIIVALAAFDTGMISGDLYTALVIMAIATSILGPLLAGRVFPRGASDGPSAAEVSATAT